MSDDRASRERLRRYILGFRLGVAENESQPDWNDLSFMRGYTDGQTAFNAAVFAACERYNVPPRVFHDIEEASVDQVMASLESLRQMAAKRAEEGVMTPEEVTPAPAHIPGLYRRALEITVVCQLTGQRLEGAVLPTGDVRWTCPCGVIYQVDPCELGELQDDVVFIDRQDCQNQVHTSVRTSRTFRVSSSALKEFQDDPRTAANMTGGPGAKEDVSGDDDQEGG